MGSWLKAHLINACTHVQQSEVQGLTTVWTKNTSRTSLTVQWLRLCLPMDMSSIPDPGRSHMPRGNYLHEPQRPSLSSGACDPQRLKPCTPRAGALQQGRPPQWGAPALPQRAAPGRRYWRKPAQQPRPRTAKKKNKYFSKMHLDIECESVSHSVVSNSSWPHGL